MTQYLLGPKVNVAEKRMLTHPQMIRLVRKLKSKKFGAKLLAYDVEEITTKEYVELKDPINKYNSVVLPPGNYYNVHVEYCT